MDSFVWLIAVAVKSFFGCHFVHCLSSFMSAFFIENYKELSLLVQMANYNVLAFHLFFNWVSRIFTLSTQSNAFINFIDFVRCWCIGTFWPQPESQELNLYHRAGLVFTKWKQQRVHDPNAIFPCDLIQLITHIHIYSSISGRSSHQNNVNE